MAVFCYCRACDANYFAGLPGLRLLEANAATATCAACGSSDANPLPGLVCSTQACRTCHTKPFREALFEGECLVCVSESERSATPCGTSLQLKGISALCVPRLPEHPLRVVVSGGGPAGLVLAVSLAEQLGPIVHVTVYEKRLARRADGRFEFQVGNRRQQVVTLRDDVTVLLSPKTQAALFRDVDERVWRASRNIPIREVEDRLLERAQAPDIYQSITLVAEELTEQWLRVIAGSFHVLVGADGGSSTVASLHNRQVMPLFGALGQVAADASVEYALGIAFERPATAVELSQAMNVLLTVSQTRYLLNCSRGTTGYLNMRLVLSEYNQCRRVGQRDGEHCGFGAPGEVLSEDANAKLPPDDPLRQAQFKPQLDNSLLWHDILEGLRLFKIQPHFVQSISAIAIELKYRPLCCTTMPSSFNSIDMANARSAPRAFLIGDAAFRVHFWPGRGMNSAIKAAVALASNFQLKACHQGHGQGGPSGFTQFTSFMGALREVEQDQRSKAICNQLIADGLRRGEGLQVFQDSLRPLLERMHQWRNRLQREGWPHATEALEAGVEQCLHAVGPRTRNILYNSGDWPVTRGEVPLPQYGLTGQPDPTAPTTPTPAPPAQPASPAATAQPSPLQQQTHLQEAPKQQAHPKQTDSCGTADHVTQLLWKAGYQLQMGTDRALAFQVQLAVANGGNAIAMDHVARCFLLGDGVVTNKNEAAKYFRMAAKNGHFESYINLAWLYLPAKPGKAVEYFLCYYFGGDEYQTVDAIKTLKFSAPLRTLPVLKAPRKAFVIGTGDRVILFEVRLSVVTIYSAAIVATRWQQSKLRFSNPCYFSLYINGNKLRCECTRETDVEVIKRFVC
eukprot:TRINITY_DN24516_c0_g1_i1.p1 TRINITY_DN24516_c0_g1~~TRINITY_DN24516_c0_g1_i1.p1  ORF type:complete len:851 (+),score=130.13 TRINITY_DN24516_c0_g1_i1:163-2715(+)